ncbi:sensor histidine kinase [Halovenus salina]|uniref:sensor histidine kinase n=1 Tax=Halovenus salina TaxID=1510225 RepID=UPI0022609323|nr:GAF domain-containing sensor histidine kinase [Halovenus salina]
MPDRHSKRDCRQRESVIAEVQRATQELLVAETRKEVAQLTAETAEQLFGYESIVVRLVTDAGVLEPVVVTESAVFEMGDRPRYDSGGETPVARAFRREEPLLVDNIDALGDEYDRGTAQAAMYLPVGDHGVVSVTSPSADAFDQRDIDLASILASTASAVLDRLNKERAIQRQNERLETFVDVIAHDIPNHLSAAESWLDIVQESGDVDSLDRVSTAHSRIETVIRDMETLVNQGTQVSDPDWVALSEVVADCWRQCCVDERDRELVVDTEMVVRADQSRFEQLVENLFWNAHEHGGDDVTVRVGPLERGFFIEDDGPGIPESERDSAFSPGYTTASGDHAGFGLAIVREIARSHGWEVTITESEAGGARFEFTGMTIEI